METKVTAISLPHTKKISVLGVKMLISRYCCCIFMMDEAKKFERIDKTVKRKMFLLVIVAFFVLGIGGYAVNEHFQKTVLAQHDPSLSVKIQQLRGEMKKNSANPDDMKQICGLLEQVLNDKESIGLSPSDIMGDESNYELKYIAEITVNTHKQRIVQFQAKDKQEKLFTYLCAQSLEPTNDAAVQTLYASFLPKQFQFEACNVLSSNNKLYISTVTKEYTHFRNKPGENLLIYTLEYDGVTWMPCDSIDNVSCDIWEFDAEGEPGCFWIGHDKADPTKGIDFVVKVRDNKMDITLVDKNNQSLDHAQVTFDNGQWKPILTTTNTK